MYCHDRGRFHSPYAVYILTSFNNLCLVLNSSINFVVYCMAGRSFRRTLIDLLCRACKTKRGPGRGRPQQWGGTTSRRTQIELTVVGANGDYDVTTRVLSSTSPHIKIHTNGWIEIFLKSDTSATFFLKAGFGLLWKKVDKCRINRKIKALYVIQRPRVKGRSILLYISCNIVHWVTKKNLPLLHTVNIKKTHLAVFETCVFRLYLRNHLSYKKSYFYLFASLSGELSDEKIIFIIRS